MARLLITGNCQRYAIAQQLSLWFPEWSVTVLEYPSQLNPNVDSLNAVLEAVDIWLPIDAGALPRDIWRSRFPKLVTLKLPSIGFSAFHPDICFVSTDGHTPRADPPFHSIIGAWCYRQQLSLEQSCALFNAQTFASLGYFRAWDESVAYLHQQFHASDLSHRFDEFFLSIKRSGCFMHTFNHPKPPVVTLLCKMICQALNIKPHRQGVITEASSTLSEIDWPVYTDIATILGVDGGSYRWRYQSEWVPDLPSFLSRQFGLYDQWRFEPMQLTVWQRDMRMLDEILTQSLVQAL